MKTSANWIWSDDSDGRGYNLCSLFRREFRLERAPESANIRVSADSFYRLKVNGQWLGDGPARAYPAHYFYESYDLAGILHAGLNQIEMTVRYFGCGTFHQQPQRAAMFAELLMTGVEERCIVSDELWQCAKLPQWVENAPKISVQQRPMEVFDASMSGAMEWHAASKVCPAGEGPWRDLRERESRPLSRREALFARFRGAARVGGGIRSLVVPAQRMKFPGDTSINSATTIPVLCAMEARVPEACRVRAGMSAMEMRVNGKPVGADGKFEFNAGRNLVVAVSRGVCHSKDYAIAFPPPVELKNFYAGDARPAVKFFPEFTRLDVDTPFPWANQPFQLRMEAIGRIIEKVMAITTCEEFAREFPDMELLDLQTVCRDPNLEFQMRDPRPAEPGDVLDPENLIYSDDRCTVVNPPADGSDIELCYDLGEQNIGYWSFTLFAPEGTTVDMAAVEYINSDGLVQHTGDEYRNCMSYICRGGMNRYISFQRRSGRYVFITLRGLTGAVRLQNIRLAESTYPVVESGVFESSDWRLNRIWDISRRTLKLCMEDTFTDCPLYEQTMWVGDARSEALFAMGVFGAYDLVRHCIRLAGQSLEEFPIVGCQVPSSWHCLLPAWSFQWQLGVRDYYLESGDLEFVREIWPMIVRNTRGAHGMLDDKTGLFSSDEWNLFDWSRTDTCHRLMLQLSMFNIGALDVAIELGRLLGEPVEEFEKWASELRLAVAAVWDTRRLGWPDWVEKGAVCEDISIHTSMLALLYDVVDGELADLARANVVTPRSELIAVSSPFASLYYYETLEKLGMADTVIEAVYRDYLPMLKLGSTTVWETFPKALNMGNDAFPTRSHCHGWSAAPLYFLPRLILGIVPAAPGGTKFTVSPRVGSLEFARGERVTARGMLSVSWEISGDELRITARAPEGVELEYLPDHSHEPYRVFFNGVEQF